MHFFLFICPGKIYNYIEQENVTQKERQAMRVIIADDSRIMANGIKELLSTRFPQFTIDGVFENGEELMKYLETHTPDMMITDIRMPQHDGLEACRKLREKSSTAIIILITAYRDFEYAKSAIRYKVHDLITKPFPNKQLIESIITAINNFNTVDTVANNATHTQKAKEYVRQHYSDPSLSVSSIAEHLSIAANYLSELFTNENNMKLSAYITQVRINAAKELLKNSKCSLQEISSAVGLNSVQYFTQLFKKETGITPTDYKKRVSSDAK